MSHTSVYCQPGEFKPIDLLAAAAAREVCDGDVVFAGTGLPMLAITLAQHEHAPSAVCIYEAGSIDGRPLHTPTSVGDARCTYQASRASGLFEAFYGQLHSGTVDLGFLGGAEIDKYGNVNCTVLGDYNHPQKRFTGSGGNADICSYAKRTVFIMVQEKRRFKEQVDYVTSPGWRIKKWPSGEWVPKQEVYRSYFKGGVSTVITDMAVFRFDETGEMYLDTVHPGFTVQNVIDNVGFTLNVSRVAGETLPPTRKQVELLYKVIDPEGIFLP
ncbi:Glutaconate CoA-transferase subunit B [Sporomusa acidovorans DSM 3132]|uniref:Glutaconate CoA-transferase subunit B n=1 Tax=Sporomusa acidovorans (strain ATCC 49682 / DSM 3132 / Mol) TaxID=1123286 RepID=A0ABZ3IZT1_SPOA4|nr:CoA-transferase [Sporomusa acidovorans]OZC12935.1 glutaconate CoA-transferase subunit B [Sporomusa acidovorans DSM 3132]